MIKFHKFHKFHKFQMTLLSVLLAGLSVHADQLGVAQSSASLQGNAPSGESIFRRIIPQVSLVDSTFTGTGVQGPLFTDVSSKSGTGAGILTDIGRGDVQFETGVLYRQVGAVITPNFQSIPGGSLIQGTSTTVNLQYVSVPFTAVAYDSLSPKSSIFVKAGLLASALVARDQTHDFTGQNFVSFSNAVGSQNLIDGIQNFEADGLIGVGGKINLGSSTSFLAELSYLRGLSSLYTSVPVYNSSLSLTAGLALEL